MYDPQGMFYNPYTLLLRGENPVLEHINMPWMCRWGAWNVYPSQSISQLVLWKAGKRVKRFCLMDMRKRRKTYSLINILIRSMSLGVRCNATLEYSTFVNFGIEFVISTGDSGLSSIARGWSRSSVLAWLIASLFVDKTGVVTALLGVTLDVKSLVSTLQNRWLAPVNQWSATPGFPPLGMTFGVTSSHLSGCCVREFIYHRIENVLICDNIFLYDFNWTLTSFRITPT